MTLARVYYEVFERERRALEEDPSSAAHVLTREVRLELATGKEIFVSWSREGDGGGCTMAFSERRFFPSPPPVSLDVSGWAFWKPLIGRPISVRFVDAGKQVIEVRGGTSVFCACREGDSWGKNVVRVSAALELPPGAVEAPAAEPTA